MILQLQLRFEELVINVLLMWLGQTITTLICVYENTTRQNAIICRVFKGKKVKEAGFV